LRRAVTDRRNKPRGLCDIYFDQGSSSFEETSMTSAPLTLSAIVIAVISMVLVVPGDAHQAGSGWTYPPACCKDEDLGGDCAAIPSSDVRKGTRGFSVTLLPGDHHLATRSHRFFIPYGDEIPSGDGNYHICLHPTEDNLNCFFAPPDNV
jgi:hypothetical protein